jgi:hypothetical protein
MRCLSLPGWGVLALSTLVVAQACCSDYQLRVGKLRGQMDFGFDVAADVEFDWDMQFNFDFDWTGWAKISAATAANLDFDGFGSLTFGTRTSGDVDDDGVDERVRLVAVAGDEPAEPDRVFAAWEGDEYSFDEGICYLLWWDGKQIDLLSSRCGNDEPALHCVMTRGNEASLSCDVCNGNGACTECSAQQTVDDCITTGEDQLPDEPGAPNAEGGSAGQNQSAGGSAGQNGPAGGDAGQGEPAGGSAGRSEAGGGSNLAGAGGAAGSPATGGNEAGGVPNAETGGSSGQGGGTSVSAEWSTCIEELRTIRSDARDCGLAEPLDDDTLCSERLSDVNLCYLADIGSGLFTSPCSVLEEDVTCGRLFP